MSNLEFAIQLEADRLVNSYIRGADLKSEMTVVRNEFEMGENDPENILLQRMMATAYRMAQLRQIDDRQPGRYRARSDRKPA